MFLVALTGLRGDLDSEAVALAADMGITPYEARMLVAGALPAVVLTTSDADRAARLTQQLRARGHAAIDCDDRDVVRSADMRQVRRFRFEPDDFVTDVPPNTEDRLPYDDISAIFRAMH